MKQLFLILGVFALCSLPLSVKANEEVVLEEMPEQVIQNEHSYFAANLQKQPSERKQRQEITNHFTFFTINVQVNGKVKDSDTSDR